MASDGRRLREAAARYGPSLDHIARRYTNPVTGQRLSGEALILKTLEGESRALSNPEAAARAVSSAGARKWGQFMPGTRAEMVKRFGVDPWRSPEEAVKAMSLHLRGKLGHRPGLEGYNPGDSSYPSYILGQRVGKPLGDRTRRGGFGSTAAARGVPGGGSRAPLMDATSGIAGQLRALSQQMAQPAPASLPSQGVPAPEFAAQAVLPEAYMPVGSMGVSAPAQPDGLGSHLEAIARQAEAVSFGTPEPAGGGQPGSAGGGGSRSAAPGELRLGGRYRGTQGVARQLQRIGGQGLVVSSDKRDNQNPYSGDDSDHDYGNKDAYAVDLATPGVQVPDRAKDRAAFEIMRALGDKKYKLGQAIDTQRGVFNIRTANGGVVRVQVIYRGSGDAYGGNHLNHIHVGVKRLR